MEWDYYRNARPLFNKNMCVFWGGDFCDVQGKCMPFKIKICCNTPPHSNHLFTCVHTSVFIALDSLRGLTDLSQLQVSCPRPAERWLHPTWTGGSSRCWPGGRQIGPRPQGSIRLERKHSASEILQFVCSEPA